MSTITTISGGPILSTSLNITGTAGMGYITVGTQSNEPTTPTNGLILYSNNLNQLTILKPDGFTVSINNNATSDCIITLPDISDIITTNNSTATLTNKTITGGNNGNNVSANLLYNTTLNAAAPTAGQILIANSGTTAGWATFNPRSYCMLPIELYQPISSSTYINVTSGLSNGYLPYPGSISLVLTKVTFAGGTEPNTNNGGPDTSTGSMRLYDMTNANVICEVNNMSAYSRTTLYNTTIISNLSTGPALWQIQARRTSANGTSYFRPVSCMLQYN